ncbi:VWA domain-containing protein [Flaviaesturariibacter flavus]|uniref:VWA domain-containing protein n=1 Tax=Flaviaesturariibacter flavus TaxID=2502780 RepID=A0A4R1BAZ6_9BACT|nr:VWA domain-containing protein [Flaviaesturariibacter flavus]TCJ14155.1 VWA domain-containing protein [Flaviaesturariibacter flavus]
MELPFDIQFERPWALYALAMLPVLLLLYGLYLRRRRLALLELGTPEMRARLLPGYTRHRKSLRFALALTALALGIIAFANPRRPSGGDLEARTGIDHVFALDVSNSMLATDVAPSRLQAAKSLMLQLLKARRNDRVALIVFAGHAYAQLPLTYDASAARLFIESANPGQVAGQGTAIGEALNQCGLAFGKEGGRYRTVTLLTDGETHDEEALKAAQDLSDQGVMINTVGIGSPAGTTIIDPATKGLKKDEAGNTVISRLNQPLLQQIAATGKGRYVLLNEPNGAAAQLQAQLSTVKSTTLIDKRLLSYETFYFWLVGPMLGLLAIEAFIPERRKVRAAKPKKVKK